MRFRAATALVCWALASSAAAEGWEVTALVGPAFPFYEQSFTYDPGPLAPALPGTSIEQRGVFRLDGRGGVAAGLALAYRFHRFAGVELRVDTADVQVRTVGARYEVRARLPAPIGDISTEVDLGGGEVDLERLRPISLNLRVGSSGRLAAGASAGVSYLPAVRFVARQRIGVGLPLLAGRIPAVDVTRVSLRAEALPGEDGEGRLGANVGLGLSRTLGRRARVVAEGRYFYFQRQTLHWGSPEVDTPVPQLQQEILRQAVGRLEPARFNPAFFQAAVGIAVSF